MINDPNILRLKVAPVLGHHKWVGVIAKMIRAIAIIVFLVPFVFRLFGDISLDMYFIMFFGCWAASLFMFLGAEVLEVLTEPGYFYLK
ncbi:hypothetical protein [Echinicola salinicaeni]|uniref:hypothetical protein n=1 Tax=Echinicola salinicaeni TaxID=2762757 RepID=UPI0016472B3E|nr:hypothetical protein [Echinicola salinicaeni]